MSGDGLAETTPQSVLDIESMLARYAPQDEIYEISLPHGERFKFRALVSYSDLKRFERDAVAWFKTLPSPNSEEGKAHRWSEFLPADATSGITAYTISALSVEPKIEQLDALKMLKAPWLVNYFMKQIDYANRSIGSIIESKILEDSKNA